MDSQFKVYSDLPGFEAPGGGTIPPEICVINLKPDIVIVDEHTKTLHIYELTMPSISNIEARHTEKTNKYSHFLTDITSYKTSLNCFEVSSTGFVSSRNVKTLHQLHQLHQHVEGHEEVGANEQPELPGLVWVLPDLAH